jgi:hypothetical protein
LVGPTKAGLAQTAPVTVSQVLERPVVLSPRGNVLRLVLEAAAQCVRRAPSVRMETTLAETSIELVQGGVSRAAAQRRVRHWARGEVTVAPIQGLQLS